MDTFIGLSAHGWTAVGTVLLAIFTGVLAIATLLLVVLGRYQLQSVREEAKRGRTIEISDRYDTDPVLDSRLRRIARAKLSGQLDTEPRRFAGDIRTILNYLESIAVGIDQDLYIERLAEEHNKNILVGTVENYLADGNGAKFGINVQNYERLMALYEKWKNHP